MHKYFNVKIIFAYYVSNEFSNLHKLHLFLFNKMLLKNNEYFNNINIYLLINDTNNEPLINETKLNILSYIDTSIHQYINFIIVQNNQIYREGLVYKNEIIDKLDSYDKNTLILFIHTKGVSNELNINNYENTMNWISIMYYFNFYNINNIFERFYDEDIITYGTLYNYDDSSLVKYKWQYTGSFHWIYPYRFINYINKSNISYDDVKNKYNSNTSIRFCAEAFIGDNIETKYAGFIDDYLFNKNVSHFLYENSFLPYYNILYVLSDLSHPLKFNEYEKFYLENIHNEI